MLDYVNMDPEERIVQAGLILPSPATPGGNYVSVKTVGTLVFLAGVISSNDDAVITGTLGAGRSIEDGYSAARNCILKQLAVLRSHLGSLNRVCEIISVNGYVNAIAGFSETPQVINGASDLLIEIFGESGKHVRAAIGVSSLPGNALVEIQMVVAIHRSDI